MKASFRVKFFILILIAGTASAQTDTSGGFTGTDLATVNAREEFRIGVQAYNRFAFNEAILSFERALSYRPGEALILDWLGRSYYRSGFEDTALRQWTEAAASYGYSTGPAVLLSGKIETVRNGRSLIPVSDDERFVESGAYPNKNGEVVLYKQPSSVLAASDGGVWVVAYGSNEIVRIDVNGIIRERKRGPINGFDRPYDIVRADDGRLFLSEFRGGRVSVLSADGDWQYYIGSKGLGPGQFVGPQNLALDEEGYLYVVDFGNKRISKFDPAGGFILSFGVKTGGFEGFKSPTGVAVRDGVVYAADSLLRRIFMFDLNGSYLGELVSEGLASPESLRFLEDGKLLAADANRVLLIDPDTSIVKELGLLGNASASRLTGAAVDLNGNIVAADFKSGQVAIMTRMDDIASGLFVQIDRVVSDNFPLVQLEVQVQDRERRPVLGLGAGNFLVSEQGEAAGEQSFLGASYLSNRADIAVLIEKSPASAELKDDLAAAVRDIAASGNRLVSLVSAGETPRKESLEPAAGSTSARRLEEAAKGGVYSSRWRFDLGLRLAATDLLAAEKKRAVVFVCAGLPPGADDSIPADYRYEQYSLSELAAYLANNNIAFYAVTAGSGGATADIAWLCAQTGGEVLPLYRAEGVTSALAKIPGRPSGYYLLSYRSRLPTDFGRAYLPVETEVYLMNRSGRDSTGYFPPLE